MVVGFAKFIKFIIKSLKNMLTPDSKMNTEFT